MVTTKYKCWDDINIKTYKKFQEIVDNTEIDELEKDTKILALLCDTDEENIWNLQIGEVAKLRKQTEWILNNDFNKKFKGGNIKINDREFKTMVLIQEMTYAQYVDFQNYWGSNRYAEILSVFLIPKGFKYNDGYDIVELINWIEENVSIKTYNELCFFFLVSSEISLMATKVYSSLELKRMRMKEKLHNRYKKIQHRITGLLSLKK